MKIFQIGFNRCGTRTLYHFFKSNNVNSVHYDKGIIAKSINRHYHNNKQLLHPKYNRTVFFSDMENIYLDKPIYASQLYYKILDRQYPNSKFILNTRNLQDWIHSRCHHENGDYLSILCNKYNLTKTEIIKKWTEDWYTHHKQVCNYFKNRPTDLLLYNIDTDSPLKIKNFFRNILFLDVNKFGHHGKSKKSKDIRLKSNNETSI